MRDQSRNMVMMRVIVLFILFTQTLSAPNGCIDSCTTYHRTELNQLHQASSGHRNANLQNVNQLNLDISRPGNWTEQNHYRTDGGHGNVHEERGQYVDDRKQVRYYKKNYTSSSNANHLSGDVMSNLGQRVYHGDRLYNAQNSHQFGNSQDTQVQSGNSGMLTEQHTYIQNSQKHTSAHRTDNRNEKLENFDDYNGHGQVTGTFDTNSQILREQNSSERPRNWNTVNSHRTDGGHGSVFEEQGQYVTGPKRVHYYKKNYTSTYNTVGRPTASDVPTLGVQGLEQEMQNLHAELNRQMQQLAHSTHTSSSSADLQVAETAYGHHPIRDQPGLTTSSMHQYPTNNYRDISTNTHEQSLYQQPTNNAYNSERHYEESQYTYASRPHPSVQPNQETERHYHQQNVQNAHRNQQYVMDENRRQNVYDMHQSRATQNQISNVHNIQEAHNQNIALYPSTSRQLNRYEEQWSTVGGTMQPPISDSTTAVHRSENFNEAEYSRDNYSSGRQNLYHSTQGRNTHTGDISGMNYNSAYRTAAGQLATGMLDLGHTMGNADCTQETVQRTEYTNRHHRLYKRNARYGQNRTPSQKETNKRNVDYDQQTHELGNFQIQDKDTQQNQFENYNQQTAANLQFDHSTQQLEDITQQSDDMQQHDLNNSNQQTVGNLEFGHPTHQMEDTEQQSESIHQYDLDNSSQQIVGKLQFGHPTHQMQDTEQQNESIHQHDLDNLSQQTVGKLQFGHPTHQMKDAEQQSESIHQRDLDNLSQQTVGKLQFDHRTHQMEDTEQQSESIHQHDLDNSSQQSVGKLHFGNPTQQMEDTEQQSESIYQHDLDNLSKQTVGKLQFGHPTHQMQDTEQQSESIHQHDLDNLSQQTVGKLQFGHPTHQMKDTEQQSESIHQRDLDNLSQQTVGKLQFGHPTHQMQDTEQQSESIHQHNFDNLNQQPVGKLQFGNPSHQMEDMEQQSDSIHQYNLDNLSQQTVGKLQFGHPTYQHQNMLEHSDDSSQHMNGFDGVAPQNSGKLDFDQKMHQSQDFTQENEDLKQQLGRLSNSQEEGTGQQKFYDYTHQPDVTHQHTTGNMHINKEVAEPNTLMQNTAHNVFGQQIQYPYNSQKDVETNEQHSEQLTQQTEGFHPNPQSNFPFVQESQGYNTLRRNRINNQHQMHEFSEIPTPVHQIGDFSQQTAGMLETGQQTYNWHGSTSNVMNDPYYSQQSTQTIDRFNGHNQESMAKFELGQQTQQLHNSRRNRPNHEFELEHLMQQNTDLTHQFNNYNDFSQQTTGNIEIGQQHLDKSTTNPYHENENQYHPQHLTPQMEDLRQQTNSFNDYMHQVTGNLEYGHQIQHSTGKHFTQSTFDKHHEFENIMQSSSKDSGVHQLTQQLETPRRFTIENQNEDLTQQTSFNDFAQQGGTIEKGLPSDTLPVPAPKPKPRPRYRNHKPGTMDNGSYKFSPQENNNSDRADINIETIQEPVEVNLEVDSDNARGDSINRGDQSVGHSMPDNSNVKPMSQQTEHSNTHGVKTGRRRLNTWKLQKDDIAIRPQWSYYNQAHNLNNEQHSRQLSMESQRTEPASNTYQELKQVQFNQQSQHKNFDEESQFEQHTGSLQFEQPQLNNDRVSQQSVQSPISEDRNDSLLEIKQRILEAYGGGPYDSAHSDDIYRNVPINPSATLSPILDGAEPWDIQEKPQGRQTPMVPTVAQLETTEMEITSTESSETSTQTPSFWGKIGNKITNSYEKAKEKAKNIFG